MSKPNFERMQEGKAKPILLSDCERSWHGGPLRKIGSSRGSAAKYVCEGCLTSTTGVYRVPQGKNGQDLWLCGGCRAA